MVHFKCEDVFHSVELDADFMQKSYNSLTHESLNLLVLPVLFLLFQSSLNNCSYDAFRASLDLLPSCTQSYITLQSYRHTNAG